jgi:hypothetical protein
MGERHYTYNARWQVIFGADGFFAICAVVLAHKAATNDRGVIIESLIRLGPEGATTFFWCLTVCSVLFVLAAIAMAVRRIANPRTLVIDATGLWIPHGAFQTKQARVEFSEILSVSELKVKRQVFLRLKTYHKTYSITESLLPSRRDYDDIKSTIGSSISRSVAEGT